MQLNLIEKFNEVARFFSLENVIILMRFHDESMGLSIFKIDSASSRISFLSFYPLFSSLPGLVFFFQSVA